MSFGMRIYDANGAVVMDENTFTVRAVNSFMLYLGSMGAGSRHRQPLPGVNRGMFAIVSPLWQYYKSYGTYGKRFAHWNGMRYSMEEHDSIPCLPSVEVYDGYIEVVASTIPYSTTYANIAVYIFTNR